jgi:hypothetical protein
MHDVEDQQRVIRMANALRRQRRELEQLRTAGAADFEAWRKAFEEFRKAVDEYRRSAR